MSNFNIAINAAEEAVEQYDEMFENEPSHENMFGIGQDVAAEASSLLSEARALQEAWISLKQKWNPHPEDSRYQYFVDEFEKLLLPEYRWVFNKHEAQ